MHCRCRLFAAFVAVALVLVAPLVAAEQQWWEEAAQQTRDEFQTVKDTVDQTVDTLDKVRDRLSDFEEWARQHLKGRELQDALEKVKQAREALNKYSFPLATFKTHTARVASGIDALMELKALADQARQRKGGDLAAALHVMATVMEKYGQKVPILGQAIEAYGKLTGAILDATDRIAKTINEMRNQGMIGTGTYGGADNPLWQALKKQYPDIAKGGYTLAPASVPYVYEPIGQGHNWSLIWDPAKKEWYKVDQPAGVVEEIYRERVIAKGHPQPWDLVVLARHYDKLQDRRQAASEAIDLLQRARKMLLGPVADAFDAVNERYDYNLSWIIRDERGFIAKYAQNAAFHNMVNRYLAELYYEIKKRGGKAGAIERWAKAHGINLAALAPANQQQQGQGQAGQQQQGQGQQAASQPQAQGQQAASQPQGTAAAQGPVKLSLVFLVDCSGSMQGAKLEAAKRAVAASVARTNDGATEWALLAFGNHTVREIVGFTRDPQTVIAAAQSLSAGGDTPLTYATYKAIAYLARNGHGQAGRLVILCDGQDNCPERGSTSREEAMAGLRTLVRVVTPAGASQGGGQK